MRKTQSKYIFGLENVNNKAVLLEEDLHYSPLTVFFRSLDVRLIGIRCGDVVLMEFLSGPKSRQSQF